MLRSCCKFIDVFLVRMVLGVLLLSPVLTCIAAESFGTARPTSITVAIDDTYPPYSFRDADGRVQGISIDYWALWEKRTGIKVNLQAQDWAKALQQMRDGKADVIDTIMLIESRKKYFDFTESYTVIEVPIYFHKSIGGIVGPESLHGFAVGVKESDSCIDKMQERAGELSFKKYPSHEALIKAAAAGEIRVFCMGKPPADYFLYKFGIDGDFRFSAPVYVPHFYRAVSKGNTALLNVLEDGFAKISDDERKKIEQKWLGSPLEKQLQPFARSTAYALLVVIFLSFILVLWNRMLRREVFVSTSDLRGALNALRETKQAADKTLADLTATLEAIPDLLFELDSEGRYVSYRAANSEHLMIPHNAPLLGRTVSEVMPPDAARVVMDALHEASLKGFSKGAQIHFELAGGTFWFELSIARKMSGSEGKELFVVLSRDITERKSASIEIERLAFFDALTLLPNRRFLLDRLQRGLAASDRYGSSGAIFFIDLDNFKTLNDTRGHRLGDLLLVEVANRLQSCVRFEDCVARLGGDEFVILLENLSGDLQEVATEAEAVAQKVLSKLSGVFVLDGSDYHSTASIGVTLFSGREESSDELLKRADAAMYRAKMAGRNTVRFFDPALQSSLEERAVLEAELRRALPEGQLELYYQAQVDSETRIVSAEVLLRWNHPLRGLVGPEQFIALAEESGLIVPIGHWVLKMACAQLKRWESHALTCNLQLSVNVSARQFRQADFAQQVQGVVSNSGIDPSRLKIELTESLVLDNVADTIEKMHFLKEIGVRFSMDDFGTGYSSLSYLKRLPLDQLKIDRSFVCDIVIDQGSAVIVQTIIGMARNFGLNVIAEGVENAAQRDFLLANGCTAFQGYLFSRPIPLSDFESRLI